MNDELAAVQRRIAAAVEAGELEQARAPMLEVLDAYRRSDPASFSIPAHKSGRSLDGETLAILGKGPYRGDPPAHKGLERLRAAAGRVAVLTDVPRPPKDIPSCVSGAMRRLRRCAFARGPALANAFAIRDAVARVPGIETVDATDRFCLPDLCSAVVGDVLVYRNSGHVTASYMKTLGPWLERRLHRTTR